MTTGTGGTVFLGPEGLSQFGRKVRYIGDVNHDGIADFAVAAPHAGNGYDGPGDSVDQAGIVYVFYGRDGDFGESFDLAFDGPVQPDGVLFSAIQGDLANGRIGDALNPAGDIDKDGIADLVVGSDMYGDSGGVFVLYGAEGGFPAVSVTGAVGGGAAWVGLSAFPGDQLAPVFAGHMTFPTSATLETGAFANLQYATYGTEIIYEVNGSATAYTVTEISRVEPSEVERLFLEDGDSILLVTCTDWDKNGRVYANRLLVRAVRSN